MLVTKIHHGFLKLCCQRSLNFLHLTDSALLIIGLLRQIGGEERQDKEERKLQKKFGIKQIDVWVLVVEIHAVKTGRDESQRKSVPNAASQCGDVDDDKAEQVKLCIRP